jgi:hypothetical protein
VVTGEAAGQRAFCASACSLGLSATSQQYFSLRMNQPSTTSRNQPAVLFSQNKPAPAISHQPTEQVGFIPSICSSPRTEIRTPVHKKGAAPQKAHKVGIYLACFQVSAQVPRRPPRHVVTERTIDARPIVTRQGSKQELARTGACIPGKRQSSAVLIVEKLI